MKAAAVIVAYHPEAAPLAALVATVRKDGLDVIVVDNTPAMFPQVAAVEGAEFVRLGRNAGIAEAQNRGIATARSRGARAILFLDQDSHPPAGLARGLLAALDEGKPGVVGPTCLDAARGFEYPSFRLGRFGLPRPVSGVDAQAPFEVDMMISSGSAATVETFDVAGLMDEDFFIDFVDHEWCLRCRAHGVPIRVLPALVMQHSIGERAVEYGVATTFVHGAARSYYRVRNPFLLFRRSHVPKALALKEIVAGLVHHALALPHATSKGAHLRAGLAGVAHGLAGMTGARPT